LHELAIYTIFALKAIGIKLATVYNQQSKLFSFFACIFGIKA
jgi:hypothetical protein